MRCRTDGGAPGLHAAHGVDVEEDDAVESMREYKAEVLVFHKSITVQLNRCYNRGNIFLVIEDIMIFSY